MSTFNITSSAMNNSYTYEDENVNVQGNYTMDATQPIQMLQNVSGSVYKKSSQAGAQPEYIGNFNGYVRDGEVRYTISEMSRRNATITWDAIDEIEAVITSENVQVGSGSDASSESNGGGDD